MIYQQIGPVEIMGDEDSRVPFSTSLVITGKEYSTVIDCGAGYKTFAYMQQAHHVKNIYLTHHHIDHMWGAQLFPEAEKFINPYDFSKISNINEIAKSEGIYAVYEEPEIEEWMREQQKRSFGDLIVNPRTLDVSKTFAYGEIIDMSGVEVVFIHAPGHTEGFCTPYIVEHGILHVGDIDLTTFGPYYGDADSDIDHFIESAKKTLEVDAKYFVTSHHKGTFLRDEYEKELHRYLAVIERREKKIKAAIRKGCPPKELANQEIFYYKKQTEQFPTRKKNEKLSIAKHLQRLIRHGEPLTAYYEEFVHMNGMNEKYINYRSENSVEGQFLREKA